jgi:hypothetical protein
VTSPSEVLALRYDGAGSTATSTTLHGLNSGQLYTCRLSALNAAGEGDKSLTMTQSTAAPLGSGTSMSQQPQLPPRGVPGSRQQAGRQARRYGNRLCLAHPHDAYMEDYEQAPPAYTLAYETRLRPRLRH